MGIVVRSLMGLVVGVVIRAMVRAVVGLVVRAVMGLVVGVVVRTVIGTFVRLITRVVRFFVRTIRLIVRIVIGTLMRLVVRFMVRAVRLVVGVVRLVICFSVFQYAFAIFIIDVACLESRVDVRPLFIITFCPSFVVEVIEVVSPTPSEFTCFYIVVLYLNPINFSSSYICISKRI